MIHISGETAEQIIWHGDHSWVRWKGELFLKFVRSMHFDNPFWLVRAAIRCSWLLSHVFFLMSWKWWLATPRVFRTVNKSVQVDLVLLGEIGVQFCWLVPGVCDNDKQIYCMRKSVLNFPVAFLFGRNVWSILNIGNQLLHLTKLIFSRE